MENIFTTRKRKVIALTICGVGLFLAGMLLSYVIVMATIQKDSKAQNSNIVVTPLVTSTVTPTLTATPIQTATTSVSPTPTPTYVPVPKEDLLAHLNVTVPDGWTLLLNENPDPTDNWAKHYDEQLIQSYPKGLHTVSLKKGDQYFSLSTLYGGCSGSSIYSVDDQYLYTFNWAEVSDLNKYGVYWSKENKAEVSYFHQFGNFEFLYNKDNKSTILLLDGKQQGTVGFTDKDAKQIVPIGNLYSVGTGCLLTKSHFVNNEIVDNGIFGDLSIQGFAPDRPKMLSFTTNIKASNQAEFDQYTTLMENFLNSLSPK